MKKILVVIVGFWSAVSMAQHGYRDGNRIGIYAGVNQTSLFTSDFNTKPELGWSAGMQVRGNYYNDFSMIFGMQFSENNFSVETTSLTTGQKQEVKHKIMGAQIRLLLSYNVVKDHVSIDFVGTPRDTKEFTHSVSGIILEPKLLRHRHDPVGHGGRTAARRENAKVHDAGRAVAERCAALPRAGGV